MGKYPINIQGKRERFLPNSHRIQYDNTTQKSSPFGEPSVFLRTDEFDHCCNNKHRSEKAERYNESNRRIYRIVTFVLYIFFKFVHDYPSYFLF